MFLRPLQIRTTLILLLMHLLMPVQALEQDVVLMLDNSGSMRKNDPQFLTRRAVETFVDNLSGETRVAILIFDQAVNLAVPLTPVSDSTRFDILSSLGEVNYTGQFTDSPAGLERAIYELKMNSRANAEKLIIFITDGIVDTGNPARDLDKARWMREELSAEAAAAGIRLFGIAFTDQADYQLIQSLASRTHGEYFRAYRPEDIGPVFERIKRVLGTTQATSLQPASDPGRIGIPAAAPQPYAPATEPEAIVAVGPEEPQETATDLQPPLNLEPDEPLALDAAVADVPTSEPDYSASETVSLDDFVSTLEAPEPAPPPVLSEPEPEVEDSAAPAPPAAPVDMPVSPVTSGDTDSPIILLLGGAIALLIVAGIGVFLWRRRTYSSAPADAGPPKAYLNDLSNNTGTESYELSEIPTMIGRVGSKDPNVRGIVLNEGTVGRRHAIITYKDFSYWISDLNSVNGTFVSDERITGEVRLKHGDRIRFHRVEFEFIMPEMFDSSMTMMSETRIAAVVGSDETRPPSHDDPTMARR